MKVAVKKKKITMVFGETFSVDEYVHYLGHIYGFVDVSYMSTFINCTLQRYTFSCRSVYLNEAVK